MIQLQTHVLGRSLVMLVTAMPEKLRGRTEFFQYEDTVLTSEEYAYVDDDTARTIVSLWGTKPSWDNTACIYDCTSPRAAQVLNDKIQYAVKRFNEIHGGVA